MVAPAKRVVTYSRKNMTMVSEEHTSGSQQVEGRKRRKTNSPKGEDARPIIPLGLVEGSERPKSKSTAKKFGGPVSFTAEPESEGEVDKYGLVNPATETDDCYFKKPPVPLHSASTLHSNHEEYKNNMSKQKDIMKKKKVAALDRRLEMLADRKQANNMDRSLDKPSEVYHRKIAVSNNLDRQYTGGIGLNDQKSGRTGGIVAHKQTMKPSHSPADEMSKTLEVVSQIDKPKIPNTPKQYLASPTSAPSKDLFRKSLPEGSKEIKLWSYNQSNSPLLRLPGEIRNRIFDLALGGNTIAIEYHTYRERYKDGRTEVVPHFKYHCTVFNSDRVNPWAQFRAKKTKSTEGFTLLNHVCRQLYQETAILPYRLNRWAFFNYLTMWNFLVGKQRLSRQQRNAITEIVVPDHVPEPNLLKLLGGLQRVLLAEPWKGEGGMQKGWYKVEEGPRGARLVRDMGHTPLK